MHVYPSWIFPVKISVMFRIFAHPGDMTRLVKDQKVTPRFTAGAVEMSRKTKNQELIRNKMYPSELGYFEVLQKDYMRISAGRTTSLKFGRGRTLKRGLSTKASTSSKQIKFKICQEKRSRASPVTVVCRTKSNNCDVDLSSEVVSSTLMSCSLFSQDKEKSRLHALKTMKMYSTSQRLIFKATPPIHHVYEVEDFSRPGRGRCCFSPVYVRSNSHGRRTQ